MKIFLTSQASKVLDQIVNQLPKKPGEYKVAFIPTAGNPYGDFKPWMWEDRNKLIELGFNVSDYDLENKKENDVRDFFQKIDIIFVAGGNTFYLLEQANKSGFTKLISELKASDKIYIGSSAGSCIAGPDIEPISKLDDPQDANLESYKAFGLVDFVVLPHADNPKYSNIQKEISQSYGEKYSFVQLKDGEMKII